MTRDKTFRNTACDALSLTSVTIDYIDIVTDAISSSEYSREEDPRVFKSDKTGRGPLTDSWREEYANMVKQNGGGVNGGVAIMCAYKLCRVEFRYWGMQGKIERFIHDTGKIIKRREFQLDIRLNCLIVVRLL
jgi:membrane-associated phosphatidylinositol transfer protein